LKKLIVYQKRITGLAAEKSGKPACRDRKNRTGNAAAEKTGGTALQNVPTFELETGFCAGMRRKGR
jgi:hypothetical protein